MSCSTLVHHLNLRTYQRFLHSFVCPPVAVCRFSHEVCRDVTFVARMEIALSALQILSEPLRRGTSLPLSQLVEESKSRAPSRQPDPSTLLYTAPCFEVLLGFKLIVLFCLFTEICAKQKNNSLIQAEPPELHFSGFELQKEYTQTLVRRPTFLFKHGLMNGLLKQIVYTLSFCSAEPSLSFLPYGCALSVQHKQMIAIKSNGNLFKWTAETWILRLLRG